MGVFIFLFIALVFIKIITNGIHEDKKRLFQAISCFLLLWLIQGLRHESIGIDSATSYRPYFDSIIPNWHSIFDFDNGFANFEIGFIILNRLFKTVISSNTQCFILFTSFLSIAPISFIIYKYSNNIIFSFWIFASLQIYYFGFSGIRQAIAISICCLSFHYIVKKQIPIFVSLVLLASTIHTSALLFLPAYWLYHKVNISSKMLCVSLIGIAFGVFSLRSIATTIVSLLFGGEKYLSALEIEGVPSYNLLIIFIVILLASYLSNDEKILKFRSFILVTVAFQSLGLITTYATRIGYYYYVFFPIIIPIIIGTSPFIKEKKIIIGIACILFCLFFFHVNGNGYLDVIPYKFFWE